MLPFWKHMLNDFGTQGYIQPFFHSAQLWRFVHEVCMNYLLKRRIPSGDSVIPHMNLFIWHWVDGNGPQGDALRKKQGYIGEPNVTKEFLFFSVTFIILSVTFSRIKCYFFSQQGYEWHFELGVCYNWYCSVKNVCSGTTGEPIVLKWTFLTSYITQHFCNIWLADMEL